MADATPTPARPRRTAPPNNPPVAASEGHRVQAIKQGPTVYQLMHELKDWFTSMARSFASFSALQGALSTARGETSADGARIRGMPIFEFKATVDGTDSILCSLDLARVRGDMQEHVLLPLATMSAQDLLDSVEEIEARIAMIKPQLIAMTGAEQQ